MVTILVTGANGQLGSEIQAMAASFPHFSFCFTDLDELDITRPDQIHDFFEDRKPDAVINCAAFTAVDKAEDEPEKALWLNRDAVMNLAGACDKYDSFLVHISTDFIFDGKNSRPYRENDIPSPLSVYGLSKLAGEESMMACLQKGLIIRTSWLYSSFGNNFVKTILKKGQETGELNVVNDQFGNPTYARDLAGFILRFLPEVMASQKFDLLHYSNEGICSWYDFAQEIVNIEGLPCRVNPISTGSYPAKAIRPAFSALDKNLVRERFGIEIPHWTVSLRKCLGEIGNRK